jgi:aryl sulfotransferase
LAEENPRAAQHHFDSTIWNDFRFRDGDIIIATYA